MRAYLSVPGVRAVTPPPSCWRVMEDARDEAYFEALAIREAIEPHLTAGPDTATFWDGVSFAPGSLRASPDSMFTPNVAAAALAEALARFIGESES